MKRPWRQRALRIAIWLGLAIIASPTLSHSTLVTAMPGKDIQLRAQKVVVIFDPLTHSQTTLLSLVLGPINSPFGILVPTPTPPDIHILKDAFFRSVESRLRPPPSKARTFDLQFDTALGGLLARTVGDEAQIEAPPKAVLLHDVSTTHLGRDNLPLDRWLLTRGLTLSPAQANQVYALRKMGWSITGIYVKPKEGVQESAIGRPPVLALTFETSEAVFSTAIPPQVHEEGALIPESPPQVGHPLVEISVISEWPALLKSTAELAPFYADRIDNSTLARWARIGRAHPWTFKRNGHMTTFQAPRQSGDGILRFGPAQQYMQIKPRAQVSEDRIEISVPVEVALLLPVVLFWFWRRARKRNRIFGRQGNKLR